ncbi:MAG: hypothetical protein JNK82_00125 [Myxococcaceae bacterium]|nr:hypothetical protein [Myxococcaceae bacterium]
MRLSLLLLTFVPSLALAQAMPDRVSASGYFRLAARPDWQGGNGRLGFWNLHGRLMNEGSYAALELKLDLLQAAPGSNDLWASVHARVEGGSVFSGDTGNGNLINFRLSQLYVRAGNLLLDKVIWQIGTLVYFFGNLGLYDLRPATVFDDTMGVSARYKGDVVDLTIGFGDSGFANRGLQYSPMLTAGGVLRLHLGNHFEVGGGGQVAFEPTIEGARFSPHQTPNVRYEDFVRREVAQRYVEENPGQELLFPRPVGASQSSLPYRVVGYLGFGNFGPVQWNNLFVSWRRLAPQQSYTETFQGRDYNIYVADLTRDRYQFQIGNELQLRIIPGRLDAVWAVLYGDDTDLADKLAASERNRTYMSTVLRLQAYVTRSFHILVESSIAQERSKNGNLFREHVDSVFASTGGISDTRGLELGDSNVRNTWQLKAGVVLNPTGIGIYSRPSLRLLYGVQYSSQQAAFGNGFSESLAEFNEFPGVERHWHHLISLEAEGWF